MPEAEPDEFSNNSKSFGMSLLNRFLIDEGDQCECYGAFKLQPQSDKNERTITVLKNQGFQISITDKWSVNNELIMKIVQDYARKIKTGARFSKNNHDSCK